ncbi:hypothetical protein [Microvirga roseola]|uniref:hypothetical protein n=1 Tax=Microvirga roseola TaxID=2883126 RepID=UPI001E411569|nr:hypothetical protein [Microvirga roseola]
MAHGKVYAAVAAVAALLSVPAAAHSWYPPWCCSDHDCRELTEAKGEIVTESLEGWTLWDGRVIARRTARSSPDMKFHLCEEPMSKAIVCFFAPPGAT